MSEHSVFAFSASPRWIPCPGSMAYPANLAQGDGGVHANMGTAKHTLSADVLQGKFASPESARGLMIPGGKDKFEVDDEFIGHVEYYVNEVQRRAIGGTLMIEQRVSLKGEEGFTDANWGTSDAIIAHEGRSTHDAATGVIEFSPYGEVLDAKFGSGVKVYAWEYAKPGDPFTIDYYPADTDTPTSVVPNYQLMMYALAALRRIELLVGQVSHVNIVIIQPPMESISELRVPRAVLERFSLFAARALSKAETAKRIGWDGVNAVDNMLVPGEKQCQWCKAFAGHCAAAAKRVEHDVAKDFDVIPEDGLSFTPAPKALSKYLKAIPFIQMWCKAVLAEVNTLVTDGVEVLGSDGKPMKFVEGEQGKRIWANEKAAEEALLGVLDSAKVYAPPKIITAPAAAKILGKAKTKAMWEEIFTPLIKRAPGRPQLTLGSDPRPAYSPASDADEFEVEEE